MGLEHSHGGLESLQPALLNRGWFFVSDCGQCVESGVRPSAAGNSGPSCVLCKELPGRVRIEDGRGRQLRICLRCDRLMQWH